MPEETPIQYADFDDFREHGTAGDYCIVLYEGKVQGIAIKCRGCSRESYLPISDSPATPSWSIQNYSPLTLAPSCLCRACNWHGYLTNGRWIEA
jgi:hypothetical protein